MYFLTLDLTHQFWMACLLLDELHISSSARSPHWSTHDFDEVLEDFCSNIPSYVERHMLQLGSFSHVFPGQQFLPPETIFV